MVYWKDVVKGLDDYLSHRYRANGEPVVQGRPGAHGNFRVTNEVLLGVIRGSDLKGRFQVAIGSERGYVRLIAIRAVQGHGIEFVDEFRTSYCPGSYEELRKTYQEAWHGTVSTHMNTILANGLLPGGKQGNRNCVHTAPHRPNSPAGHRLAICEQGERLGVFPY